MGRTPRFRGWDFTELITVWGLPMSDNGLDDKADINTIREYIFSKFDWPNSKLDDAVKKDMRLFLKSLLKCEQHYGEQMWKALLNTDDDFTFANYFCTLLPHMWT